jgi:16S rRNA (uracil1498-N3)-methyltransferase
MARFYCPTLLITGELLDLPANVARHVQVLRLQPGDNITLFDGGLGKIGNTGEFVATITQMGRSNVQVMVGVNQAVDREANRVIHLVVGMPANERMDWLVEKATELGVASIRPLMTERSVLRLFGERAEKKVAHWQSVAQAACEQCGGNRVPVIHPAISFTGWIKALVGQQISSTGLSLLLSLRTGIPGLRQATSAGGTAAAITLLSGPEGGLNDTEEESALICGFTPVTLGSRVLRAETAAMSALAALLL